MKTNELKALGYKTIKEICNLMHRDHDVNIPKEILQGGIKKNGILYPPLTVEKIKEHLLLPKAEKRRRTCKRKYGVENVSQSEEIKKKKSITMISNYGIDKSFLLSSTKETIKKRYGVDNISQNEEIKKRKIETIEKNYGVKSSFLLNSYKSTIKNKYGVENISQNKDIKQKKENTCFENYGVKSYQQSNEARKKRALKYKFSKIWFDSSWEMCYYSYCKDLGIEFVYQPTDKQFWYVSSNKKHRYFPDFKVLDRYVEIKGDQFFNSKGELIDPYRHDDEKAKAKWECIKENNILVLREIDMLPYIKIFEKKYGNRYNFRRRRNNGL